MKTKVILKRVAIRVSDLDENDNFYFEDFKRKGKIVFYPKEQNGHNRVCVFVK